MMNMDIWDKVHSIEKGFTKSFTRRGGFRGTAINAQWLMKRATEIFGPCGSGWGWDIVSERDAEWAGGALHIVRIKLWYQLGDQQRNTIETFGHTQIIAGEKGNYYIDEDYPKKSLTDAITKALSYLGFGADVHLGLFDDNKYAAEPKSTQRQAPEETTTRTAPRDREPEKQAAEEAAKRDHNEAQMMPLGPPGAEVTDLDRGAYIAWWDRQVADATSAPDLKKLWFSEAENRKKHFPQGACPEIAEMYGIFVKKGKELAAKSKV